MPILTDKQEPEDFDKPPDDDPNAYVLSYLFSQRRPSVELQRTGQVLILAGAGTNVMATLVLWFNLDFGLSWLLWLLSSLIPILSVMATLALWRKRPGFGFELLLIMLLELSSLIVGLLDLPVFHDFGYAALCYLPGVLVMVMGCLTLLLRKQHA